MKQYIDLVNRVLKQGIRKPNRTGVDTIMSFAEHMKFNLRGQLPIVTTKYVPWKIVLTELLWYLRGEEHIRWLRDEQDVHIWDEWVDEDGYLGPAYSVLWRRFPKIESYGQYTEDREIQQLDNGAETFVHEYDQIQNVIDMLKNNPTSRRIVLSTWYPGLESEMGLPPCHLLAIWNTTPLGLEERMNLAAKTSEDALEYIIDLQNGKVPDSEIDEVHDELDRLGVKKYSLSCHLTQRSADIALGVPFNITCYSALTKILAHLCNMVPGTFSHLLVDAHIYENHIDGLKEQMKRQTHHLPELVINQDVKDIDDLTLDDLTVSNYQHEPKIKFEVAV